MGKRARQHVLIATDVRREWRLSVRKLSAGLIALALSACATTQQAYPGAPQPDEATAVIYTRHRVIPIVFPFPGLDAGFSSRVYQVDGQDMRKRFAWNQEVRILPGTHTVLVGYADSSGRKSASLTFTAKAGEHYVVDGGVSSSNASEKRDPYPDIGYQAADVCISVWIENLNTHEVIVTNSEGCK